MTENVDRTPTGAEGGVPTKSPTIGSRDVLRRLWLSFAQKREIVRSRREALEMEAAGYRMHEIDWEINRGARYREVILDVKISRCGKYVWAKIGMPRA